ncbi:hypothetical protein PRK78_006554 [Emydomyces testavorans]|uniref:Ankyrin repeat protein n=1 Tax=Emydomyces testavorans TaxID=2070801 RepID=A0AAF0DLL2_9EURO|nr:hypothetical protein PRK78_006554 [Emydomyces testavorans]
MAFDYRITGPDDGIDDVDGWEGLDPLVVKWGQPLVNAIRFPEHVARCLEENVVITGEAVMAAAESGHKDSLYFLFLEGASPNMRVAAASPADAGVAPDWATRDVDIVFRDVCSENEWLEWFPLQAAANSTEIARYKDRQIDVMRYLLVMGADPYALYRAPLERPKAYRYPGETFDEQLDPPNEDSVDLKQLPQIRKYGTRSVIHSIFEDGGQVLPFFDEKLDLDIERRDPQGRTVLHSACRSVLGADAILDSVLDDRRAQAAVVKDRPDPFTSSDDKPTLFHALRLRNADMLAVDSKGKHILHHLLETLHNPKIDDALAYTLRNLSHLANQPDYHGNFPLHAALQCLRCMAGTNVEVCAQHIEQLLAAGADPLARDARGNTALHYLAASTFHYWAKAEGGRSLFRRFLELGVDVNARNKVGRTAIEIFLDDDSGRTQVQKLPATKSFYGTFGDKAYVYVKLLDLFDEANIDWTERNANGQSLLHLVALQPTKAAVEHAEYLLAKGVDVSAKDKDGKMAADVAEQYGRDEILRVLCAL